MVIFDVTFLDLDATLYDTPMFVREIRQTITEHGVSEEDFSETMKRATFGEHGNYYNYTFELQLQLLQQKGYTLSEKEMLAQLDALFNIDRSYKDADAFLLWCKQVSNKVILLSAGNTVFQKAKLRATQMEQYFDDLLIVQAGKEHALVNVFTPKNMGLSVNDSLLENRALKIRWPNLMVITKEHPTKYTKEEMDAIGCPHFPTLTHIQQYLSAHYE